MFSGGVGSWATARRVVERHGTDDLVLLFADTLIEDADLYRFLTDASRDIGVPVTRIAEGRTPEQVFRAVRFLGNTRVDPCSRVLKREPLRKWLDANCDPAVTVVYLGIDWTEEHRFERAKAYWRPWAVDSPLCDAPYATKHDHLNALRTAGIKPPRLYDMGFAHNNCGGGCVKAGQGQFVRLYRQLPAVYGEWEGMENRLRDELGDVSILRDRTGGETSPLTLTALRERIETQPEQLDLFDIGGCGCMEEPAEAGGAENRRMEEL